MSRIRILLGLPAALTTLAIFIGVLVLVRLRLNFEPYANAHRYAADRLGQDIARLDSSLILLIASIIGVVIVCRARTPRGIITALGLHRFVLVALLFALVASLPMLIGYAITGSASWDWPAILHGAVIAAFVEEVFFRGFAYRRLHEQAGWGFWPAALFTGFVFGLMHVPMSALQSMNLTADHLFTILITGAGGVFYAWLYMRWKFNLWVPIFLHMFMNLWWMVFAAGDGAVGGLTANICRALTIAAAVVLTLNAHRLPVLKRGMALR